MDVPAASILEGRARELARPIDPPTSDSDLHLVVRAGTQRVALKMSTLRSVVPSPPMTRLRVDGLAIIGVVALAGEVVPVVDLNNLLGIESSHRDGEPTLVVVDDNGSSLALTVDEVEGHDALGPHLAAGIDLSVTSAPGALATPVGHDGLLVLDVAALLADRRLSLTAAGPDGRRR